MKNRHLILGIILVSMASKLAYPTIVGGTVTIIDPPLKTGNNNQLVNKLLGFNELQHVVLNSDLVIDKPVGIIPAGTVVSSHYIIYNPVNDHTIDGTVILDQNVIGVIYKTNTLNNSDFLGLSITNYLNPSARGFDAGDGDTATIEDPNTVSFHLRAGIGPGDYARIITTSNYTIQGPQFIMRVPQVAQGEVHTNKDGIGSVRLLFDQPVNFNIDDVTVLNENAQNVVVYATGSGSPLMVIAFNEFLFADKYTITVHDTVSSIETGYAIDGDNDGNAGGDIVFTMEHRKRTDINNDNGVNLSDLVKLAEDWLWEK